MKIVSTYIAYDGMEFDNERECREHEQYAFDMYNQILECVHFYNAEMEEYWQLYAVNVEEVLDWLEETYSNCSYIKIIKEIPSSAWSWCSSYFDFVFPEEAGFFEYYMGKGWVKVDE